MGLAPGVLDSQAETTPADGMNLEGRIRTMNSFAAGHTGFSDPFRREGSAARGQGAAAWLPAGDAPARPGRRWARVVFESPSGPGAFEDAQNQGCNI